MGGYILLLLETLKIRIKSDITVPIVELTTSCRLLQNKNPKDPWTDQGPIPLPDQTKLNKFFHYDQDTRPGCEPWHEPVDVPFSGEAFNDSKDSLPWTFIPNSSTKKWVP